MQNFDFLALKLKEEFEVKDRPMTKVLTSPLALLVDDENNNLVMNCSSSL